MTSRALFMALERSESREAAGVPERSDGGAGLDANGAIAPARMDSLRGVEADGVDRALQLLAEVRILTADDATDLMNAADSENDVIDDSKHEQLPV
jgi:hypothetical protein